MTLGIVGGMGVQATALFYEKLINLQRVSKEQDYVDALIFSKSSIPDRTAYIIGHSDEDPALAINHAVQLLRAAGCGCIVIPCVTSHYFWDAFDHADNAPLLHMPTITARGVAQYGYKKVGLLATSGTIQGRLFHDALASYNVDIILPNKATQIQLMDYIYAVKQGNAADPQFICNIAATLHQHGVQAIILGCTELSIGNIGSNTGNLVPFIDALDLLAQSALDFCKQPLHTKDERNDKHT